MIFFLVVFLYRDISEDCFIQIWSRFLWRECFGFFNKHFLLNSDIQIEKHTNYKFAQNDSI